jgi:hypothetical protein
LGAETRIYFDDGGEEEAWKSNWKRINNSKPGCFVYRCYSEYAEARAEMLRYIQCLWVSLENAV